MSPKIKNVSTVAILVIGAATLVFFAPHITVVLVFFAHLFGW